MFTPTLRCECAQPASDRLMRKWCITYIHELYSCIDSNKYFYALLNISLFFSIVRNKVYLGDNMLLIDMKLKKC